MTRADATRRARLEFGSRDKAADECREASRFTVVEDFARDLRHSLRSLKRHPGSVIISVASLALGIGVNAVLFNAIRAVIPVDRRVRAIRLGSCSYSRPADSSSLT